MNLLLISFVMGFSLYCRFIYSVKGFISIFSVISSFVCLTFLFLPLFFSSAIVRSVLISFIGVLWQHILEEAVYEGYYEAMRDHSNWRDHEFEL